MADLIKKIKIKKQDGTFTDYIPIGAEAQNISTNDGDSVQLKLNKKPYYYNNVADMKADTKLKAGDMAITLGYYSANDGGNGEYRIINGTYTDDGGSYHALNNSLFAELIIKDNTINILQFGAKGDGVTNDLNAFNKANNTSVSTIYFPYKTNGYFTTYINVPQNKTWLGDASHRTIINQQRNDNAYISIIREYGRLINMEINSLDIEKPWNRINVKSNAYIENCKITGFRDTVSYNAWGLYFGNVDGAIVKDCVFENNSQSDIAIVDGNSNIIIDNCTGPDFRINFEPNGTNINKDIIVKNCNITKELSLLENTYEVHPLQNIIIENCNIKFLNYRGAVVTLLNNKIESISYNGYFGGIVHNINSYGYTQQINDDPFLYNINSSEAGPKYNFWHGGYTPSSGAIGRFNDPKKGDVLKINPEHKKTIMSIKKSFNVKPNTLYEIRTLMNTITGESTTWSGFGLEIAFYDDTDTIIGDNHKVCIDRNVNPNTETEWEERVVFFQTPENCSYVNILLSNTNTITTTYTTSVWKYLYINEVDCTSSVNSIDIKNLKSYGTEPPTASIAAFGLDHVRNLKGQRIYLPDSSLDANSDFEGWICVAEGNPSTWKKFGSISNNS